MSKPLMQPKVENDVKPNPIIINTIQPTQTIVSNAPITTAAPSISATVPLFNSSNVVFSEQQTTTIHATAQNPN